jgi:hypothetical protein
VTRRRWLMREPPIIELGRLKLLGDNRGSVCWRQLKACRRFYPARAASLKSAPRRQTRQVYIYNSRSGGVILNSRNLDFQELFFDWALHCVPEWSR